MARAESSGASIYYERRGEGPAVVFAHGAGGNTLSWWQQVPRFAERYCVITFDHRCFGRSTCAPDDFHPVHFPDDLLAILDAEGIERASLVCQSMGGWTGLRTALQSPERVRCLVLCGTPGGIVAEPVLKAAAAIAADARQEGIRGNLALAPDFPTRRPELATLYDAINSLNERFEPRLLARMYDERGRVLPEEVSALRTPTLVLAGEHDQLFPPAALQHVAGLIPGAKFREVPVAGHSIYFEVPEMFNQIVEDFLASEGS